MSQDKYMFAAEHEEWHRWLAKNHDRRKEIWLIFYKKNGGRKGVKYEEAVEEALCFGWVDSIIRKIDEDRYARKFTPRKEDSRWSNLNIARAKKMIAEGRMNPSGLARFNLRKIEAADSQAKADKRPKSVIPRFIKSAFLKEPLIWANFRRLPPSHKRNYVNWISSAKREETRLKRLREAVGLLKRGERLGMK